jgi:hypothetical protein
VISFFSVNGKQVFENAQRGCIKTHLGSQVFGDQRTYSKATSFYDMQRRDAMRTLLAL